MINYNILFLICITPLNREARYIRSTMESITDKVLINRRHSVFYMFIIIFLPNFMKIEREPFPVLVRNISEQWNYLTKT